MFDPQPREMMEDFHLKSADYFAEMDVNEDDLPPRLLDLMSEIDTLSDEFDRVGSDEEAMKIQKEIERLDNELLAGLKAYNTSQESSEDSPWPEVNTATPVSDSTDENRDGEQDSSSPYFWM